MSVKGFLDKYFGAVQQPSRESVFEPTPPVAKQIIIQEPLQIKSMAIERPDSAPGPKRQTFHIFTDGACSDNGRRGARGGFGVYVYSLEDRSFDKSEALLKTEPQTNNRGELKAIQAALDIIESLGPRLAADFDVYWIWTDSEYSINCLTKWVTGWRRNGWKTKNGSMVQNADLIKPISDRLLKMPRVTLHHVRGHQESRKHEFPFDGNFKADELAKKSIVLNISPFPHH